MTITNYFSINVIQTCALKHIPIIHDKRLVMKQNLKQQTK